MCTSASFTAGGEHFFGRNLDLEVSFGQQVAVAPRRFPFEFRSEPPSNEHPAMIGMALVSDGYPLYFDAVNEHGLGMAGLNFPGEAVYRPRAEGKRNVSPFEFIPWVLCSCSSAEEARDAISEVELIDEPFSERLPLTPLHWMIADRESSIVVESDAEGVEVYDDPFGVLTNCPPFPYHRTNVSNYMGLSARPPENRFSDSLDLKAYSRGMGAIGLPGDLSSSSRFVKAAFTRMNSTPEPDGMTQFFHILDSVQQQRGCCDLGDGRYEYTVYSSCCDTAKGVYCYRTYGNSRIVGVDMHAEDLDSSELSLFPLRDSQDVLMENRSGAAPLPLPRIAGRCMVVTDVCITLTCGVDFRRLHDGCPSASRGLRQVRRKCPRRVGSHPLRRCYLRPEIRCRWTSWWPV